MAAGSQREVMREFLMSLGFSVDESAARRWVGTVLSASKVAAKAGAVIGGTAVALEAFVQQFTHGMENLFYMSQRTRASVESLQAARFAAAQVGVSVEGMTTAVEGFARAVRMNPGMGALLKGLGVDTKSKDTVQQLYSFVERISKLPHFIGAQWAQMFGMDEQTFLMLKTRLPELLEADRKRRDMNKEAGVDAQKAAEASREYANVLGELWARVKVLGDGLAIELLPFFRQFIGAVNEGLKDLQAWVATLGKNSEVSQFGQQIKDILVDLRELGRLINDENEAGFWNSMFWYIKVQAKNALSVILDLSSALLRLGTGDIKGAYAKAKAAMNTLFTWDEGDLPSGQSEAEQAANRAVTGPGTPGPVRQRGPAANQGGNSVADYKKFATHMAKTYGIPPAILHSMFKHESNWDPVALSKAGAIGIAQLMPGTAKDLGVNNLEDPYESMRGGAQYLAQQHRRFGNWHDALAAYNAGPNSGLKAGRGYADTVLANAGMNAQGQTIINNNITVNGAGDPETTARAVGREVNRVNQDIARNRTGTYR